MLHLHGMLVVLSVVLTGNCWLISFISIGMRDCTVGDTGVNCLNQDVMDVKRLVFFRIKVTK